MAVQRAIKWCCFLAAIAGVACREASAPEPEADAAAPPPPTFAGGGAAALDPFDPDAAIAMRMNALIGASCVGGPETACHGSGAAGLTLRLGSGGDVVNVPSTERPELLRVRPFDPADSYLFLKVRGDGGIDGGRMPLGVPEDPRIAELVRAWIEAGAPAPPLAP